MITRLPASPSATEVKSFWIVLIFFAVSAAGLIYRFFGPSTGFIIACLAAIFIVGVAGIIVPSVFRYGYKGTRALIRIILVQFACLWISGVVFIFILLPNRLYGSWTTPSLFRSGNSLWDQKSIQSLVGGSGSSDLVVDGTEDAAWLVLLLRWIKGTRNWWMLSLIPFMLLLSLIDSEKEDKLLSKDTYTLY
ncbi:MAG: hypothetical protein WD490_00445 [Opitutales bacterium]